MFNIDLNKSFTFLYFNCRIFVRLMGISNLSNLKITQLKWENSWQREEEYNCIFIPKKKKILSQAILKIQIKILKKHPSI